MAWFLNFYECAGCKRKWTDQWSSMCDDDCPHCGARHMSPYDSEELTTLIGDGRTRSRLSRARPFPVAREGAGVFVGGRVILRYGPSFRDGPKDQTRNDELRASTTLTLVIARLDRAPSIPERQ